MTDFVPFFNLSEVLEFDNMTNRAIDGSRSWKLYSLKLPIQPEGKKICVSGILIGKGKLWLDDFKVFVDGKDIQLLK
ncbi:hypothetical protein [Arcticibacter eurypsychrophilus]|uniref:hypothetical protein n=1 Tax=Arcticibacter eurypsychrophilus TaxID=1434752 RepID=UPI00084E0015|nr:hypothetical protein [Arcticibacter eurypsychrophilus]